MKDIKNMKKKDRRKGDNQIKRKNIRLKLMQKKSIYLIFLVLDQIFYYTFIIAYYSNDKLIFTIINELKEYEEKRCKKR